MAIQYAYDYFNEIGVEIDFVTVFEGDKDTPPDLESEKIWKKFRNKRNKEI